MVICPWDKVGDTGRPGGGTTGTYLKVYVPLSRPGTPESRLIDLYRDISIFFLVPLVPDVDELVPKPN